MNLNNSDTPVSIWLAEGQSSQRDMLLSLQQLKHSHHLPLTIFASHRKPRPEILSCADIAYTEPDDGAVSAQRVAFVLNHCIDHQVKVLLTGRNSRAYEAERQAFSQAGIRLLTGATDIKTLDIMDDKARFIQFCHQHDIPVAEGWQFDNVAQLHALLEKYRHLPLCVKPVTGIFAQGFWQLDTGLDMAYDSFEHLYFTEEKRIHLDEFIRAYTNSQLVAQTPIAMLLMPYLAGDEYSIDVVCEQGEVLAAVTRCKHSSEQHIGYEAVVMDVVVRLVSALKADGIISIQTKADSEGKPKVLEVNSRPSGGIAYTDHAFSHSQLNLTQLAFAYWAGFIEKPNLATIRHTIAPCVVRPISTSVTIGKLS